MEVDGVSLTSTTINNTTTIYIDTRDRTETILTGTIEAAPNSSADGILIQNSASNVVAISNDGLIRSGTLGGYGIDLEVAAAGSAITNTGLIQGYAAAILNKGTLANVSNSGTITGTNGTGIDNVGTIGALTNSGTIIGGNTGIDNVGTIGALTNSGTISGDDYAIHNTGSLGAITNSGTISGNVSSSDALTLNGGSGTTGTYSGGTITAAGVTFASGTLALADAVSVGSGTVINSGAAIGLTTIVSIAGNYNQTGGTLALGSSGELVVSGAAGITGGSISASLSDTGNYLAGTTRTLVAGNDSSSYGGTVTITAPTELSKTTTVSNGDLQVLYRNDYIGGSLASLTNSGTISGADYGVYVASTGILSALSNSGTISGTDYAIYNAGSLGLVTDSGLIGGNIYSSTDFSIAGGGSGTYGTLSGGTITVGSSGTGTLGLTSGYLWLMDAVKGNVRNDGATVKLSSAVAVSGNYSQTGGGLVIATNNSGTSYGYLTVTGSATISNTAITISGSGLSKGETFTIVDAGSTSSYTNDTAKVSGTSGLSAALSTSGDDLVVTLNQYRYATTGRSAGGNAGAMGAALEELTSSGSASSGMQTILSAIDGLESDAAKAQAIKELGPSQVTPAALMGFAAAGLTSGAVEQHQQTAMAYDPASGKAAGSDGHENILWGQVMSGGATRGGTADADGYRMRQFGLASGVDHMIDDSLMGGLALSWVRGFTHGADGSDTASTLDSYQLTAYGTWRPGHLFVDGQAGIGLSRFHQKRGIDFLNKTATADFGGEQYLLRGQTGYDIPLKNGLQVTPLGGLTFLRGVTGGYTESGADAADLTVKRRADNSLSHDLGGKVSWAADTEWGRLTYSVRTEWVHDYQQAAITTSGSLDGAAFATTTPRLKSDGAQIGLALALDTSDALSIRAEYTSELRESYQSHLGSVKFIWGF